MYEGRTLGCGCKIVLCDEQLHGYEWACERHYWSEARPDKPAARTWVSVDFEWGSREIEWAMRRLCTSEEAAAAKSVSETMEFVCASPMKYAMLCELRDMEKALRLSLSTRMFS